MFQSCRQPLIERISVGWCMFSCWMHSNIDSMLNSTWQKTVSNKWFRLTYPSKWCSSSCRQLLNPRYQQLFKQWFLCQCCEKYEKLIPAYNSNQHIPASAALTPIDWGSSMFSHNIFPSKWCLSVGCLVALTNVEDRFWLTHSSKFYPSWKFIHGGSGHSLIFVQVAFNIKNIFPRKWCLSVGCLVKVIKIGKRFRLTHPSKLCPSLNPLDQNWPQGPVVWWKPLVQQRDRMESRLTMCGK